MAYKLIDLIREPIGANVWITGKDAKKRVRVRFVPGREYYDYVDDPVFMEDIRKLYRDVPYTAELEKQLKSDGVKYVIPPRTCSCQRKMLRIWYMEVID